MNIKNWKLKITGAIVGALFFSNISIAPVSAGWFDDLKNRIFDQSTKIEQIKQEINTYKAAAEKTREEAKTLDSAVSELSGTKQKLDQKITSTESSISATENEIKSLEQQIADAEMHVRLVKQSIGESIRTLNQGSDKSLAEIMLGPESISEALKNVEAVGSIQGSLFDKKNEIIKTRDELTDTQQKLDSKKQNLLSLKDSLSDQKRAVEVAKAEKAKLLAETKNKESEYQRLIREKEAQERQFESELYAYQSQLKGDPNSLPSQGTGVLGWPVANPIITQQFGLTTFARTASAYNKQIGHNGIDLGARIGTAIMAAESGTVFGTGNTDLGCPRGSYGKWVMVKHPNGLSTLYAHLGVIKVSVGQQVARGETIALSGSTGYATGPHLHFGVYESDVTQIGRLQHANGTYSSCGEMPLTPLNGYLNPVNYL